MKADKVIPPMPPERVFSWEQPDRKDIEIDDTNAFMSLKSFKMLKNYTDSQPTGAYEGKMWRVWLRIGKWYLRWFDNDDDPRYVVVKEREIVITDLTISNAYKLTTGCRLI